MHRKRDAFTLIELLVTVAIITLLMTVLLPALSAAREQTRATRCAGNLRQVGLAFVIYRGDWNDTFVPMPNWKANLWQYVAPDLREQICYCPSRHGISIAWSDWFWGQGYNVGYDDPATADVVDYPGFAGRRGSQIVAYSKKILIAEWGSARDGKGGCNAGPPVGPTGFQHGGATSYWAVCRVHRGAGNLLFGDGHTERVNPDRFHSRTLDVDADGVPMPSGSSVSPEWRQFWDTAYE
ncbi:MAG: type II secretion system protein [Lentisphaerae bacterium]|nr:type II secretion system protein [Lentisphaerota bacterium]